MQPKENGKIYLKEFGSAMLLYVAATLGMGFWERTLADDSMLRFVAAMVPVIPVLLAFWAIVRFIRRSDEMMRQVQLMAAVMTLGITIVGCIALGFLQAWANLPNFSAFYIAMFAIFAWGMLQGVVMRRFK